MTWVEAGFGRLEEKDATPSSPVPEDVAGCSEIIPPPDSQGHPRLTANCGCMPLEGVLRHTVTETPATAATRIREDRS